jgi:hypothetical protein
VGILTGSTTLVVTWCLRKASATTSIDAADASMPDANQSYATPTLESMNTGFNNINADVLTNGIDLLPQELWWCVMYVLHTKSILSRQSSCSSHCIAAMRRDNLLICL